MSRRQNIASGGKYEKAIGYSRAVRIDNLVFVSGTTGTDATGKLVSDSDSYTQARQAILNIEKALKTAGSSLQDVVRTRVFVRPDTDWEGIAKAHLEFFGSVMPASSMLVCNFLNPNIIVEIEADAVIKE